MRNDLPLHDRTAISILPAERKSAMSKRPLDQSWTGWLHENLKRECNPEELLGILLKNDFTVESIRVAMGESFPGTSPLLGASADAVDYRALSLVRIHHPDTNREARRIPTDRFQLFVLDDFMSEAECAEIIDLSETNLRSSTVTTSDRDPGFRTSSTCDLSRLDDPFVKQIDRKISRALGIRLPYSEGIQAQRYEVGQQFKAHTDFFAPGTTEYASFASKGGNRTWTFMVFLNDVEQGGGTRFIAIDATLMPRRGTAVIWNNLHPDGTPNPDTMHAGLPVEKGHKIIITKWFREYGAGPMFTASVP